MQDKKQKGAYYTPKIISDFMVRYLSNIINRNDLDILEPSVGDGVFIESLIEYLPKGNFNKANITLVEIEESELKKAEKKLHNKNINYKTVLEDFLKFNTKKKFSLIIGNPPYIKKSLLNEEQKILAKKIHQELGLSKREINNIWTAFVIKSVLYLTDDGILSFVLPADFLQVKYSEEIRMLLENIFARLDVFIIDNTLFPEIDQRVVLLFAYKKNNKKGVYFYKIKDINNNLYKEISSNGLTISNLKWNHYLLETNEINLLNKIYSELPKINDFVTSNTGIVTGANNYFIVNKEKVEKYNLHKNILPIVQKGSFVNGKISFEENDFKNLVANGQPTYLLNLKDSSKINLKIEKYLRIGEELEIPYRYKCSQRTKWYIIPNIKKKIPELLFYKRSHLIPKLILNNAKTYVTDAAYEIYPIEDFDKYSFVYSFYNIITLIFAELLGRKYGGGVLELTPNEFKKLPILFNNISIKEFKLFEKEFQNTDNKIQTLIGKSYIGNLNQKYLSENEFDSLVQIYSKLNGERFNTGANIVYKQWRAKYYILNKYV